jgi:hypothetical protein
MFLKIGFGNRFQWFENGRCVAKEAKLATVTPHIY